MPDSTSSAISQIFSAVIARGEAALDSLERIAPSAVDFSYRFLKDLLSENKDTAFGRQYGFAEISSYADYKEKIPLTTYENYAALVDCISNQGQENVLTDRPIVHFCPTTGTTSSPKLIPVVKEAVDLVTAYTLPATFALADRTLKAQGKPGFEPGKGLFLVEVGALSHTESGVTLGGICSTAVRASNELLDLLAVSPRAVISPDAYLDSKYLHALFALKSRDIRWIGSGYMTTVAGVMDTIVSRWEELCADIEAGTINPAVEMSAETRKTLSAQLRPDFERAEELRAIFSRHFEEPLALKLWPKLSFIAAIGSGSFRTHTEKVRRFVGDEIPICNIAIAASETIVAVAAGCNTEDFILLPQAAFFEFIPADDANEWETCAIDQLRVGKKYELVVTTLSGLYRYRLRDVVEVTGYYGELPTIRFSHRANVFLNIAGEKTTESDLLRAIQYFSEKTGIKISEYAAFADTDEAPGHYVVLLESDDAMNLSEIDRYSAVLEEGLAQTFGYKYERLSGNIEPVRVYIQQRQTHQLYRELQIMKGAPRNQLKPVRILRTPATRAFFLKMIDP